MGQKFVVSQVLVAQSLLITLFDNSRNTHLWRDFPRPPGERRRRRHLWSPSAPTLSAVGANLGNPFGGGERIMEIGAPWATLIWGGGDKRLEKKNWGACGAPNGFKNLTHFMRIPNMCLVLKLDNGKVVSIANGQNHGPLPQLGRLRRHNLFFIFFNFG